MVKQPTWYFPQTISFQPDYKAIAHSCNIWRNYDDIQDSWDSVKGIIDFYGNNVGNFSQFAAPGSFNDPDMVCMYNLLTKNWIN